VARSQLFHTPAFGKTRAEYESFMYEGYREVLEKGAAPSFNFAYGNIMGLRG